MDLRSLLGLDKTDMVEPGRALPGRDRPAYPIATTHAVLAAPLQGPWGDEADVLYVGMGCFWGAEKRYWSVPGVVGTAVGYQGGVTSWPTYEETCTGRTGHTESVLVAYDRTRTSTLDMLRIFWENHDPTQGYRQGNDIGTQYRSTLYWTTSEQAELCRASRQAYNEVLVERGIGQITTEMGPADERPFYLAEEYHQQYLFKNPHGYDCHAHTGVLLPM